MTQIKTAQESLKFWLNNQDTWIDKFANFNLEKFKDDEISELRARVAELEKDTVRLDWLESMVLEVRVPERYGSRHLFFSQTVSDEEDNAYKSDLRSAVDARR